MTTRGLRDLRGTLYVVGTVVFGLGAAIAVCAAVGWGFDRFDDQLPPAREGGELDLLAAAGVAGLVGLGLAWYGKRYHHDNLSRREAVLAVALIWLGATVIGAIPFVFGAGMSVPDALFETASGLTTTGATVVADIEGTLGRPLLLWRSLIQWLGGMGIVVLFVAVFPSLRAGGKQMFGEEVPGTAAEGLRPRIAETSRILWVIYLGFTGLAFLSLWLLGLSAFDSLCHALTTTATGGFSTKNDSLGAFQNPWVEIVVGVLVLLSSLNYGLYYVASRRRSPLVFFESSEFKAFVGIVAAATAALSAGLYLSGGRSAFDSFRHGFFTVATSISSTGFATHDYMAYPSPLLGVVLLLMFVGGCSGSTAGGMKVERIVLLAKLSYSEVLRSFQPNLVLLVRMGRARVSQTILTDASVFVILYFGAMATGVVLVCALEAVPLPTAFGAVLTALSNMGPAPFYQGADNFAGYGDGTKMLFAMLMLLGRLEFFALLSLFTTDFWRA